jgi:uncharacterized repeat protein (TIGR01451 family)
MKKINYQKNHFFHIISFAIVFLSASLIHAQVIRPYSIIYSDNLRGGHTVIGNTMTAIYTSGSGSTGIINTAQMNDFSTSGSGNYTYGRTSAYGNDNSNIQLVDVDGILPPTSIIATGDQWNYSNADAQPTGWPDVSNLPAGPGASPLGYGPTGTVGTALTDHRTYYFTRAINFNPATYSDLTFTLTLDDGAVVYVNGTEVGRANMPAGTPTFTTNASSNLEPEQSFSFTISNGAPFINGNNIIQVEVHSSALNETGTDDLYFDLQLGGNSLNQTDNSSSANLSLPPGANTIKFARLYWGGRITTGMGGDNNINLRTVKFRFNGENYQNLTAAAGTIDKSLVSSSTNDTVYQAYFDVTNFVNSRGSGTYTVGNLTAATGVISGGGYFAGWALVVVYENPASDYSSLRLYDGFLQVYNNGSGTFQTITLTGLNPPANFSASADAYMSIVSWEGDANLAASSGNPNGDYIQVNGTTVSNAVNPVTNFWNGTISKNGAHLAGTKNPDFKNQMGIDIDEVEVGTGFGISSSTTSVEVEFGTEADQYFPSIFAFTMKTKPPLVQLDKIVKDTASGNAPWQIPNNLLNPNEILTYTMVGKNLGDGNALNCIITDTIPNYLTYRVNSLKVNAPTPGITPGFKTDAGGDDAAEKAKYGTKDYIKFYIGIGATASSGGILAPNDSFSVQFQCIVPSNANAFSFVANTARITGTEQDGITPFVDDGTAIIGPMGIGLPVKLTEFTVQKQNNDALLKWTTASEINNDHFDIERSTDGINFRMIGIVNGSGTTNDFKQYQFIDPINNFFGIIYYRLKSVDIDNKGAYSKIIALRTANFSSLKDLAVYPNPFSNSLKLQLNSTKETIISIRIISTVGQQEGRYDVSVQRGQNIIVLSNLGSLNPGLHLLEISTGEGKFTQRIFKQ